jgi:Ca2+-dependent lipid-binding protein
MSTSDSFCRILCNGSILETSVKWQNLNPDFYESFEIDVTNPTAKCEIIVFDKDYIGSDDFMGKIVLNLADYADGKEKIQTFLLFLEGNIYK